MWAATFHAQNTGQLLPPAGRIDSFRRWAGLCRFLPPNTRTQMLPNAYSYQQKQCWKKQHLDLHCLQETVGKAAISRSIRDWFERSMCTNQAHVLLFFFSIASYAGANLPPRQTKLATWFLLYHKALLRLYGWRWNGWKQSLLNSAVLWRLLVLCVSPQHSQTMELANIAWASGQFPSRAVSGG